MTKPPDFKALKDECDRLWSAAILQRDGRICQACYRPGNQPHHIFGRRYMSTRHDLENGICLCWACHKHKAHGDVERFRDFIIKRMGQKRYDALKVRAYSVKAYDLQMSKIELKEFLKELASGLEMGAKH